jgi:hypothetical protein
MLENPKSNISKMRHLIADFFTENKNNVMCHVADVELDFQCENIEAIQTGVGGRCAYGGINEIVAFGVLYSLAVTVFAPENQGTITYNTHAAVSGQTFPEEMLLNTLGWSKNGNRHAGCDHWQRCQKKCCVHLPNLASSVAIADLDPSATSSLVSPVVDAVPSLNIPLPSKRATVWNDGDEPRDCLGHGDEVLSSKVFRRLKTSLSPNPPDHNDADEKELAARSRIYKRWNEVRRVACGVWRVACGVWRVACGVWRVACDELSLACDVWRVACDVLSLACGVWRVTCGVWRATC